MAKSKIRKPTGAPGAGRRSRDKGKRGELLFRDVLRAAGWPGAERGQQRAGGADAPDVRGGPQGVHFEVKFVEALSARRALDQAVADAEGGALPIVAWKTSRAPWVAILGMDDLLTLLRLAGGGAANAGYPGANLGRAVRLLRALTEGNG